MFIPAMVNCRDVESGQHVASPPAPLDRPSVDAATNTETEVGSLNSSLRQGGWSSIRERPKTGLPSFHHVPPPPDWPNLPGHLSVCR